MLPSGQVKYPPHLGLELDYTELRMNFEQETRESRGSVSYTDYYSSEDGQIRRSVNDNCLPLFIKTAHCTSSSNEHSVIYGNSDTDDTKGSDKSTDKIHVTKFGNKNSNGDDEDYADDEEHTLTFKKFQWTSKNDLQRIFNQSNNETSALCKKIGR